MKPKFFATPAKFRAWLEKNHADKEELLVGFYKKDSGKPSITWPESVDEALCFGWIDGVRKSLGDESYTIRFTPRRPRSIWSAVNVKKVKELIALGKMEPAGLRAFEARGDDRTAIYSYEQRKASKLTPDQEKQFRANKAAWSYFEAQRPSYRRTAIHWVTSAKKVETRQKRLELLVQCSAKGSWVPHLIPPGKRR